MPEYYHFDRSKRLISGAKYSLQKNLNERFFHEGMIPRNEAETTIEKTFLDGISEHGIRYLMETNSLTPNGEGQSIVDVTPTIELVLELVRRTEFKDRPSRYCSFFACKEAADLIKFLTKIKKSNKNLVGNIARIKTDYPVFIADMNLLNFGHSGIEAWALAKKYWSGEKSADPAWEVLIPNQIEVIEISELPHIN